MVNSVSSASSSLSNAVSSTTSSTSMDKNDFLMLMIEQLKSQDPLNPTDSSAFTSQLAQFTSLEQLTNINQNLESSISANLQLTQSINNTLAPSLINKDIKLNSNTVDYTDQSNMTFGYELPSYAKTITVNVYDEDGNVVKTFDEGSQDAGEYKLSWDFTDNNGKDVPSGTYTFKVTSTDLNGEDITTDFFVYGQIEAVRYTEDGTKIVVNGFEYYLSDVTEIIDASDESGGE